MNKRGFTLIELLVSIAILAIITTSIALTMTNMLENEREKELENYNDTISNAACTYADINDIRESCSDKNNCQIVLNSSDLINSGLIDKNLTNPSTNKLFSSESNDILVNWNDGAKSCTYK